jgi:hypothetical protein
MKSPFQSLTCGLGEIKQRCTKSPFLCWAGGIAAVLGVPLGLIVAFESKSLLAGLGYMVGAALIGLLVCRKEIIREYNERRRASTRE